jgi:hypothetical protein
MKIACISTAMLAYAAATCSAQIGTAFFEWQVSTDAGSTWQSGAIDVPQTQSSVRVRAVAGWSADAGYGFGGAVYDALIDGIGGAGQSDRAENFFMAPSFAVFSNVQTLNTQRFGNILKIDDRRDTFSPGVGTRGVTSVQANEQDFSVRFDYSNPISIFEFTLALDGSLGTRAISEAFLAPNRQGANNTDRMLLIRNGLNSDNLPLVTRRGASITVIPAPSAMLAALTFSGLSLAQRRRTKHNTRRTRQH